ncbi:MAG TPA: VWA domain-containing protein, partial [Candidatus Hydrogenedentes bacterium]|nr:VWA domain-containing protein [Candidatus Hydrogenedentota bacterium]
NYGFEVLDEDRPDTPLIITIQNTDELSTGMLRRTTLSSYPVETIRVGIDRSQVDNPVEYRRIRIYDRNIPTVQPLDIQVRVEQAPLTIEGAINRSRPPYVMRFVFLIRDRLGRAVPTITPEDRAKLAFAIEEDDIELAPDETNQFVTGPENLKVNLVLLLDFTGSMYRAGVADPVHPLEPGEAIEQMVEAAKGFIDDIPDTYRIALMEYHDKQQADHLIHGFTTDKQALRDALDAFSLPAGEHGASEIRDTLVAASELLLTEDPNETIPFDDADVRAVVFVTDGWDTSSINTVAQAAQYAKDARVRLYPIGFNAGQSVNSADLVKLSTETGGHVYYAPTAESLGRLLANEKGLALGAPEEPIVGLTATFDICNVGGDTLPWTLEFDHASWLDVDVPHTGTVLPGGCYSIGLQADDAGLLPGNYIEKVRVLSTLTEMQGGEPVSVPLEAVVTLKLQVVAGETPSLTMELSDEPGRVWRELRNQVVLSYISLVQQGQHGYRIRATYTDQGVPYTGQFREDGVYWVGDIRQGQVSLWTTTDFSAGPNSEGVYTAEAYVRADYVPRNISQFRMRFFTTFTPTVDFPETALPGVLAALPNINDATVEIVPDGPLAAWRMVNQGNGVYTVLTEEDTPLQFGVFGTLLKVRFDDVTQLVNAFDGLDEAPYFELGFRLDNTLYHSPASPPSTPSRTKYFAYPGARLNPGAHLVLGVRYHIATPAANPLDLTLMDFDPEDPYAWDPDEDGVLNFDDPAPFDETIPREIVAPRTLTIVAAMTQSSFTLRNERFDPIEWTVAAAPAWLSEPALGTFGTLPPGTVQTMALTVDRTGLGTGLYAGRLVFDTTFGEHTLNINLVVGEP